VRQTTLLLLIIATAVTAAVALPSAPRTHVLDQVGLMSAREQAVIAANLLAFEQRSGIQLLVAVLDELEGSVEGDAVAMYESWGIGAKGEDRGVLICLWPNDGHSRIEVGYGLEGDLTDLESGRFLQRMVEIPRNEPLQRVAFLIASVAAEVAPGDPLAEGRFTGVDLPSRSPNRARGRGLGNIIWLLILISFIGGGRMGRNRWLGPLIIASALGGGRRGGGGGGFGGGGFSGGGGMSGGGGASGGW